MGAGVELINMHEIPPQRPYGLRLIILVGSFRTAPRFFNL